MEEYRFNLDRIKEFKSLGIKVVDLKEKIALNDVVIVYKDCLEVIDLTTKQTFKFREFYKGLNFSKKLAVKYGGISKKDKYIFTGREYTILKNDKEKSKDHLYFIKAMGYIKIGRSKHPKRRLCNLSVSWPEDGEILGILWGKGHLEKDIHQCFKGIRIRDNKEWFYNDKRLITFIKESCNSRY